MKSLKRILSCFLVIASFFSFCVPFVFADSFSSEDNSSLWDRYWSSSARVAKWVDLPFVGSFLSEYYAWMSASVCPSSRDGWHHSEGFHDKGSDSKGKYFLCECTECYDDFKVYTDDIKDVYNKKYKELTNLRKLTTVTSDGGLIWTPTEADLSDFYVSHISGELHSVESLPYTYSYGGYSVNYRFDVRNERNVIVAAFNDGRSSRSEKYTRIKYTIHFPASGVYTSTGLRSSWSGLPSFSFDSGYESLPDISFICSEGNNSFEYSCAESIGRWANSWTSGNEVFPIPVFDVTFDELPVEYSPNSRPSITVDDHSIVNEDNHTVYNPVTKETYDFSSWTYDYSTRTYNFTTADNDTYSLTYGDDAMEMSKGGDTYTISYVINNYNGGSGSGGSGGSGSGGDSGGSSGSGTDISNFGKLGELLGTLLNGILTAIAALLSKLLDGLISIAEVLAEKLVAVVELILSFFDEIPKLFGGFLDFLSAAFIYLPADIMLLITFGIAAVVFIGIIKAIRR